MKPSSHPFVFAWALVVASINLVALVGLEDPRGGHAANLAYAVGSGALVLARRRLPVGAAILFALGSSAQAAFLLSPTELAGSFLCLMILPYAAAVESSGARGLVGLAAVWAAIAAVEALGDGLSLTDVAFPAALATASFLLGGSMRSRTRLAAELHELAVRAEEEREAEALAAVAAERRRIARELHDVVAHSMSVMVVQAGGARRILDQDPARAAAAAVQIERSGREALLEMRRLLGFLNPGDGGAARAPQPGLDRLDQLVDTSREAGLPVTLRVEGAPREMSAGLDLTAYRIVQESLTNALKHAGAAPTGVELRWSPDELEIVVADRGRGPAAGSDDGRGHGLVGMQERVRLYGGDLRAGPRAGGGFEVRARLPLQTEEVTA